MIAIDQFRVRPGSKVNLAKHAPGDTREFDDRDGAKKAVAENVERLAAESAKLWAENERSLLVILQGMDTSGKDGTVRHVMSGVDPTGCKVHAFKRPSPDELDHDFLWRVHARCPARGEIAIFNRSHYEDVLIARVRNLVTKPTWSARYEHINSFEKMLADSGTIVLKFFLHISKAEQKARLQERLDDPAKSWKFEPGDLEERKLWDDYQRAYEDALARCSTEHAPWFIIPADKKWFRNLAVSQTIVETLESLKLQFPKPKIDVKKYRVE